MPALSDKAKGKQRAIDPLDDNSNSIGILSSSSRRNVTIRFTDGHPDIIITVEAKDSVRDVKRKVFALSILSNLHSFRAIDQAANIGPIETSFATHLFWQATSGQLHPP